jgi:hypothetical protein
VIGDEENQETRESPALSPEEVTFTREDAESAGDPAAAGAGAEGDPGSAPVEAPGAGETAATATTGEVPQGEPAPASGGDDTPPGGSEVPQTEAPAGSPAAAQERAEAGDESPIQRPEVQILAAFLGAFVFAQILKRLFGKD